MRFRRRLHVPLQQVTQISYPPALTSSTMQPSNISLTRTPCNGACRKLIGARFFNAGIQVPNFLDQPVEGKQLNQTDLNSPRDYDGHGSHTLSTAGGGFVQGASAFGRGKGTAKGGSPRARVASYKACYTAGCSSLDILAAILAAVEDGVHVLSLSVGAPAADYVADLMAIGTLY
uniref:Peptidase S8/S53 domain-containing protein n=1 Tax=Aegilops tauschii subsp. strangulata TaxID=200361 RepID=A0A453FA10_AEGTS